ncbi:MAG TPA: ABC transporter ATP-binding protein [Candidatus Acidoferrales bacterium]|nr:ABC transporter ATP-binding protein [Candidatus Acidoferrales bacterium]
MPLLGVRALSVRYRQPDGTSSVAVHEVSFEAMPGETLGIVGESGSGKTSLALGVLQALPKNAQLFCEHIRVAGRDIAGLSENQLRSIRGSQVSTIFQESGLALHPMMRAVDQVAQVYRAHFRVSRSGAKEIAMQMLARIFGQVADRIARAYPHELSGGQKQRVLIAQALICRPSVVIADEPTASLDAKTQREVLQLLDELRRELNLSVVLITHNIAMLSAIADQVMVMHAGRVVERGSTARVLHEQVHPYTRQLIQAARPWNQNSEVRPGQRVWHEEVESRAERRVDRNCVDAICEYEQSERSETSQESGREVRRLVHER